MKRFIGTAALTCVLFGSSLAGEIPSVGVITPPPPPSGATSPTTPGDIPSVGFAQEVSEAALDLVDWVLSAAI